MPTGGAPYFVNNAGIASNLDPDVVKTGRNACWQHVCRPILALAFFVEIEYNTTSRVTRRLPGAL
jgi:hypothetical protein